MDRKSLKSNQNKGLKNTVITAIRVNSLSDGLPWLAGFHRLYLLHFFVSTYFPFKTTQPDLNIHCIHFPQCYYLAFNFLCVQNISRTRTTNVPHFCHICSDVISKEVPETLWIHFCRAACARRWSVHFSHFPYVGIAACPACRRHKAASRLSTVSTRFNLMGLLTVFRIFCYYGLVRRLSDFQLKIHR